MTRLLKRDPSRRPKATELLLDPWLKLAVHPFAAIAVPSETTPSFPRRVSFSPEEPLQDLPGSHHRSGSRSRSPSEPLLAQCPHTADPQSCKSLDPIAREGTPTSAPKPPRLPGLPPASAGSMWWQRRRLQCQVSDSGGGGEPHHRGRLIPVWNSHDHLPGLTASTAALESGQMYGLGGMNPLEGTSDHHRVEQMTFLERGGCAVASAEQQQAGVGADLDTVVDMDQTDRDKRAIRVREKGSLEVSGDSVRASVDGLRDNRELVAPEQTSVTQQPGGRYSHPASICAIHDLPQSGVAIPSSIQSGQAGLQGGDGVGQCSTRTPSDETDPRPPRRGRAVSEGGGVSGGGGYYSMGGEPQWAAAAISTPATASDEAPAGKFRNGGGGGRFHTLLMMPEIPDSWRR